MIFFVCALAVLFHTLYEENPSNIYSIGHTTPNTHEGGLYLDFTLGILLRDTKYPEPNPKIIGAVNKIE